MSETANYTVTYGTTACPRRLPCGLCDITEEECKMVYPWNYQERIPNVETDLHTVNVYAAPSGAPIVGDKI